MKNIFSVSAITILKISIVKRHFWYSNLKHRNTIQQNYNILGLLRGTWDRVVLLNCTFFPAKQNQLICSKRMSTTLFSFFFLNDMAPKKYYYDCYIHVLDTAKSVQLPNVMSDWLLIKQNMELAPSRISILNCKIHYITLNISAN